MSEFYSQGKGPEFDEYSFAAFLIETKLAGLIILFYFYSCLL